MGTVITLLALIVAVLALGVAFYQARALNAPVPVPPRMPVPPAPESRLASDRPIGPGRQALRERLKARGLR